MNRDRARRPRRGRLRALVLAASVVCLGAVTTAPAPAAPEPATAGSLSWSIRSSTSSYHFNHPNGTPTIVVADGASPAGTLTSFSQVPEAWTWRFLGGTYDSDSQNLTARYGGSVLYQDSSGVEVAGPGPSGGASPFTYLKIANPVVTLDFTSRPVKRTLSVEVTDSPGASPTRLLYSARVGPSAGLSPATPAGDVVRYAGLGVLISDAYSNAYGGGFLPSGSIADPLSFEITAPARTSPPAAAPRTTPPSTPSTRTEATSTTPDAPGDPTDDPRSSSASPAPAAEIAAESSTPPAARPETSLDGQTVTVAVQRVDDSGSARGLALFGAACLAALVLALSAGLLLRRRRGDAPA